MRLDGPDKPIAEAAVVVARRLEQADTRAAPALARELVGLVDSLRDGVYVPDRIDALRLQMEARHLAANIASRG